MSAHPKTLVAIGGQPAVGYRPLLTDNALEWAKWIAMVAMFVDHINTVLFGSSVPVMYAIGRLAFPIFAFVFGANLARILEHPDGGKASSRAAILRLVGFGAAAQIPFAFLHGHVWPLNVLFLFALSALLVQMLRAHAGGFNPPALGAALILFFVGGLLPEFFWFGLFCVFASVYLHRWGESMMTAAAFAVSVGSLVVVNDNVWALGALLVLVLLRVVDLPRIPRIRLFFYAVYPAHLFVLWAIALATGGIGGLKP